MVSLIVAPVVAASVAYTATINIANTTATNYGVSGCTILLPVSNMITTGMLGANAFDAQVTFAANVPMMATNDRVTFAQSIMGNSTQIGSFTTNNAPVANWYIIPGAGGYVTIADSAALEPGGAFKLIFNDVYVNTSGSNNLLTKGYAFQVSNATTNVTYTLPETALHTQLADSNTSLYTEGPVGSREAQTFTTAGALTGVTVNLLYTTATTYWWPTLVNPNNLLVELKGTFAGKPSGAALASATLPVHTGGSTIQAKVTLTAALAPATMYAIVMSAPTGTVAAPWNGGYAAGGTIAAGTRVWSSDNGTTYTIEAAQDLGIQIAPPESVMDAIVATGEHDFTIEKTATHLSMTVDGVVSDNVASTGSVPNLTDNWKLFSNTLPYTYPYMKSMLLYVGGVLVAQYAPSSIITGTVLPNLAAVTDNGTFTFGSSPVGVTIGSMYPASVAAPVSAAVSGSAVPSVNQPSNMTTTNEKENAPGTVFDLLFTSISQMSGSPAFLIWMLAYSLLGLVAFVGTFMFTQHLWISGMALLAVTAGFTAMGVIPGLFIILVILLTIGLGIMERTQTI
jgi:hypothetical protein